MAASQVDSPALRGPVDVPSAVLLRIGSGCDVITGVA
jgi:hypothetical protein